MSKKYNEKFTKLMPGIALYTAQTRSEGVEIESAQGLGLFANKVYAFPPSSLDEKNEQLVPGLRFLCILVSRLRTENNSLLFASPAEMIAAINTLQPVQGLAGPIADIALEIMAAFGDISDEDYANAKAEGAKNIKRFVLSQEGDDDDKSFDAQVPESPDDTDAADTLDNALDPSDAHTPSAEQALKN